MRAAFQFSESTLRKMLIVALLFLPAITLWNVYAKAHGKKRINFGNLRGVVQESQPIPFSFKSFADGSWQKATNTAVTNAIPTRPVLIRISNSIRVSLFGHYGNSFVTVGDRGHLIETGYLEEYCRRNLETLKRDAPAWAAKLKELQDHYAAQKKIFIYTISPSKAAHFPELFLGRYPCMNTERDRKEWVPLYTSILRQAGVNVVDSATSSHFLKGRYPLDIFAQGGVHWNEIGIAHAASDMIAQINRDGFSPPLPAVKWTYQIAEIAQGLDRDLLDLVNVLIPNPRYPTARVTYSESCPPNRRPLKVAMIGGSFAAPVAQVLNQHGCIPDLNYYSYLYGTRRGGEGYKRISRRSTAEDIRSLRDADIVILEENESVFPASAHGMEFYNVIMGKK